LPNGKVLAVGGLNVASTDVTDSTRAVKRPQIWDPGAGTWTDTTVLARQPSMRNYHSTAVLLPDGRVLSGGGEFQDQKFLFNAFCPPYLFKTGTDVLATRPAITGAPDTLAWGSLGTYTLRVQDTTQIRRACLIRPGATTHGFDQNERYVPLTVGIASSPSRVLVSAPAHAADAPPGDYLLFVSGSNDAADVPSIARWVKVSSSGLDTCDTLAPAAASDFNAVCDPNTWNGWIVSWTATADDGSLAASGNVTKDNVRKSSTHITDSNWSSRTTVYNLAGGTPGTTVSFSTTVSATTYLRMKSGDNANRLSALS